MPGSDAPRRGHRLKRWLYLTHRWIGIASCLLFAMWFLSGLVMIYVPYPSLTKAERLAGLTPIDWSRVRIGPEAAGQQPDTLALEMRGGRPVWRFLTDKRETDIDAGDGHRPGAADAVEARINAEAFSGRRASGQTLIARDQWTVAGGYDRHRPLWKVDLAGSGGHVLYVSSRTGAVVLDTAARERFWNWLGSVPHWLYPTVLRQDNSAWRQVVMWVSGPCIAAALTGMWIGILRTRPGHRRFKGGRMTPYRGWMLWHHVAGLAGGLFLLAWIFSGWLSVDPFRLFAGGEVDRVGYERAGAPPPLALSRLAAAVPGARQVALHWFAGRPLIVADGITVLDAATMRPPALTDREIVAAARALVPGAPVVAVERLTAPDAYWYAVGEPPLLPALRIRFGDRARSWVHIDPRSGALLDSLDTRRRTYRWLFDLLHKWDLNVLTGHRPAWDILLWLLSIAGIITSISGIRVGWSRLTRG